MTKNTQNQLKVLKTNLNDSKPTKSTKTYQKQLKLLEND